MDYQTFAPALAQDAGGAHHVDNRFTRFTGKPPVILAGMTPTTGDAEIVAAAANAGFMVELAGGSQVTEEIFRLRAEELRDLLVPGATYSVNLLYLESINLINGLTNHPLLKGSDLLIPFSADLGGFLHSVFVAELNLCLWFSCLVGCDFTCGIEFNLNLGIVNLYA
jgi:hypothetical protein